MEGSSIGQVIASERPFVDAMAALDHAIRVAGSQQKLADRINRDLPNAERLGQSAISNWKQRGQVPANMALPTAKAVEFSVFPHELRRDMYPNLDDGVPSHFRLITLVDGLTDVLTPGERAGVVAAILNGPSAAVEAIQSLDLAMEARQELLKAAGRIGSNE